MLTGTCIVVLVQYPFAVRLPLVSFVANNHNLRFLHIYPHDVFIIPCNLLSISRSFSSS